MNLFQKQIVWIMVFIASGYIPHAFSQSSPSTPDTRPSLLIKDGETIAFLGDSITAGGGSYGGYCRLVVHGLKTKGIRVKGIYAGVPGNKSSDMLLRLDAILKKKPDHLFLSVGVNDVWHTDPTAKIGVFKPSPGLGVELEHYKIYVPQILDRCKAAGTGVIMSTFTQITEDPEHRLNKKAKAYNDFLKATAKKRGLPIALLNEAAWAKIAELKAKGNRGRNVISSDGIHPTGIGHQTMALGVLEAMGLTDTDLAAIENEWNACPQIMAIGDRQVYSGTRPGGWRVMLLDCLNSGRAMMLNRSVVAKPATLGELIPHVQKSIDVRTKVLLFVPPMGDLKKTTPLDEYAKAVDALIELAKSRNLQLVISTYAIVGADPNSEVNTAAESFNHVLREACSKSKIPLADIAKISRDYLKRNPGATVNFGDERFNHVSGKLMAEAVFKALGGDDKVLPALREIWDESPSYTFRYEQRIRINVSLLTDDLKAMHDVSARYHKLEETKILELGIQKLLYGEKALNEKRLASYRRAGQSVDMGPELRVCPDSDVERQAIDAYVKDAGIDVSTFYARAFLVGLYVLRHEDPLGRGKF